MDWSWITTTWTAAAMSVVTAVGIYLVTVVYTRLAGLRSFSKMSSFDFAITVAFGSVIASSVLTREPPLLQAAVGMGALYALQMAVARTRVRSRLARSLVDNEPLLLMRDGEVIEAALRRARVSRADLLAKLREANVLRLDQVRAVVFESTGDISVLHAGADEGMELEDVLLDGVRGA